jgi:site-specific DNA-methyltransferase (adenine-specific)
VTNQRFALHHGDALAVLRTLPTASCHALVTDPPSGIGFMGAEWDSNKGGRAQWVAWLTEILVEARRVLVPGAHALIWALPRTSHWTATAVEDAGFEVRDNIVHLFGQGFPKSLDVSKAIDKAAGAKREVIGSQRLSGSAAVPISQKGGTFVTGAGTAPAIDVPITAPSTDDAKRWAGWGTALKPAAENWILARAPLAEKSVAANVLRHGVGAINIDACRIGWAGDAPSQEEWNSRGRGGGQSVSVQFSGGIRDRYAAGAIPVPSGRFPANVLLSHADGCREVGTKRVKATAAHPATIAASSAKGAERERLIPSLGRGDADGLETVPDWRCAEGCPVAELDAQSGERRSSGGGGHQTGERGGGGIGFNGSAASGISTVPYFDTGGASRFFYCAKPSTADKSEHLDARNEHPTVKSVELMRYLVRLVTPPGGIVLDPFTGSGTTGLAALLEEARFIGVERDEKYAAIARRRISHALGPLFAKVIGGEV